MAQRRSHHKRHGNNRLRKESPHRDFNKDFIQGEVIRTHPQILMVPSPGPWSAWALDAEQGFYYRTRINAIGRYEWDFQAQSSPSQASSYVQPEQANCYRPSPPAAPASSFRQYMIFPTDPAPREDKDSCDSDFSQDFDDEVTSRAPGSSFVIPAIIDVDTKNNVKVLVPDPKTGEATKIWDNKHKHSRKSKISPDVKVREWLYRK
ncbi:uncharacterized protein LY79DRAFT_569829 [Colletotrichum navitas]|uniref:Uncharacterized protein n=1 Tax=Colletotrichum navitas TaxID=681940 RepID=A0AAD8PMJ5_9PEZI|nr:uncharacterized protein LY79DRAFT_569829 [Colletotrichum navitas]KAK1572718.1 hypothetical protein LY79DRAFT_569829 [Colletotrichum navitas]